MAAISVSDPFGAVDRTTVLEYLERCYAGEAGGPQKDGNKAGAGMGLHLLIEQSDMVVFNIEPGVTTEVIALFSLQSQFERVALPSSLHFFSHPSPEEPGGANDTDK